MKKGVRMRKKRLEYLIYTIESNIYTHLDYKHSTGNNEKTHGIANCIWFFFAFFVGESSAGPTSGSSTRTLFSDGNFWGRAGILSMVEPGGGWSTWGGRLIRGKYSTSTEDTGLWFRNLGFWRKDEAVFSQEKRQTTDCNVMSHSNLFDQFGDLLLGLLEKGPSGGHVLLISSSNSKCFHCGIDNPREWNLLGKEYNGLPVIDRVCPIRWAR